jgi:hypothetical protein
MRSLADGSNPHYAQFLAQFGNLIMCASYGIPRICWRVLPMYEDVQLLHSKVKGLSASIEGVGDWKED